MSSIDANSNISYPLWLSIKPPHAFTYQKPTSPNETLRPRISRDINRPLKDITHSMSNAKITPILAYVIYVFYINITFTITAKNN